MNAIYLFAATYVTVFALGFQSLNVNQGHAKSAFIGSLVIGASNLVVYKLVPDTHTYIDIAAYLFGGPLGVVSSMWVHRRTLGKREK